MGAGTLALSLLALLSVCGLALILSIGNSLRQAIDIILDFGLESAVIYDLV
jgi:hypothetical protein